MKARRFNAIVVQGPTMSDRKFLRAVRAIDTIERERQSREPSLRPSRKGLRQASDGKIAVAAGKRFRLN